MNAIVNHAYIINENLLGILQGGHTQYSFFILPITRTGSLLTTWELRRARYRLWRYN